MKGLAKKIILFFFCCLLLTAVSSFVFARELETQYPEVSGFRPQDTSTSLPDYVKYIFNFSVGIAGLIAFIVLAYAGFSYITSAGSPAKQKDARDRIFSALIGFVVLFGSYLILSTVNPQLTYLAIPERIPVVLDTLISVINSPDKENLSYTEIPLGGLMAALVAEEKLDKIKDGLEDVEKQIKEVGVVFGELANLVASCGCQNCKTGTCQTGSGSQPDCKSDCQCLGAPREEGDPCGGAREQIDKKSQELNQVVSLLKESWQKFEEEINSEEGFYKVYNDLLSAEEMIKNCNFTASDNGTPRNLLNYNEFWQYLRGLEQQKAIKKTLPEYPFKYIDETQYQSTTFYCTEVFYSITPDAINENITGIIDENVNQEIKAEKVYCGAEIKIGEITDQLEKIGKEILEEVDNIKAKIEDISENSQILSSMPEQLNCANCLTEMKTTWNGCGDYSCAKCCPRSEKQPLSDDEGSTGTPDEFGCLSGCCAIVCEEPYCDSCACQCNGSPYPSGLITIFPNISISKKSAEDSADNIRELIKEKKDIISELENVQEELRYCISSETVGKELQSCSYIKGLEQGYLLFYDESGEEIKECYSRTYDDATILDNYFCCRYKITE